ncbi:MAG: FAD-binding protein [Anaerolineae bacterium]|nr:FAD-binding protein [Anaerolineae bacterium]
MDQIYANLTELSYELQQRTEAEVRFDQVSRTLYATDASNYQIMPIGVVIPRTTDDVIATIEICARYKVPVLPRGGGSSLAGQTVGEAVVIDTSKYLRQILSIDSEAREVRVQPGITFGQLNRQLKNSGLMVGPDPASGERAAIGGCIGNNATGAHSILYGMFADHVLSLQTILADGSVIELKEEYDAGRATTLWHDVCRIIDAHQDDIRAYWPRHWRRASGYNLNYMLPDAPGRHPGNPSGRPHQPNLAQLVCGSEGTLAVITEATLNLMPRPKMTALGIIQFDDMIAALEATNIILELNPSAVELMDRLLVELTRQQPQYARMLTFVEGTPEAILAVEFYGESESELTAKLDRLEQQLTRHKIGRRFSRAMSAQAQADVWGVRKVGLGLFMSIRGDYKPIPVIEDFAVPVETLPQYMAEMLALAKSYDTRLAIYGHASAGCLHLRPLINVKTAEGVQIMKEIGEAGAEIVFQCGGVTSGEHSDGLQRSYFNEKLFGPKLYQAMRQIKAVFDPDNLLNPGKVVEAPDPTQRLRYGANYSTIPLETFFDWSDDGGLDRAVEMCNGAGVCRKLDVGTMCPSYMATQDEQDTTRARANVFRALLSGTLPLNAMTDQAVYDVFELCIGCKACKSECPSSVDMARIKTEYKAQYYARVGYPMRSRLISNVPRLAKWAASVPGGLKTANFFLGLSQIKALMRRIGLTEERQFPRFAAEPFSSWFQQRSQPLVSAKQVLLFNDTWTEYNYPEIGQAAVKVLEAAGYQVNLETQRECCGRPLLTCGMVDPVKQMARRNVDLLLPYVEKGWPIIGLEPSCILSFRDEYPALMDAAHRDAARRLSQASLTIDEFLHRLIEQQEFPIANRQSPIAHRQSSLLFHGHCHQKALSDIGKSLAVLKAAGYEVEAIPSGCCGMAGNFGYEAEHYAISQTIGRNRLISTIEARPDAPIVANGISCREQIEHMTDRRPRHLIEWVAEALGP